MHWLVSSLRYKMNNYILPKLHPDLKPYLQGDELHHPLLQLEGGVWPALYQRINQCYQHKIQQLQSTRLPNEWESYLQDLSHSDRQIEFIKNELGRQDPEYFRIVGQIWTDIEVFGCTSSVLESLLTLHPFSSERSLSSNVIHMMTISEQEEFAKLPDEFTVYRGHHPRLLNGLSWTLDKNIALQYALGFQEKRNISTGIVSKTDVVAYIDRWSENEIIVPTKLVRDIRTKATS